MSTCIHTHLILCYFILINVAYRIVQSNILSVYRCVYHASFAMFKGLNVIFVTPSCLPSGTFVFQREFVCASFFFAHLFVRLFAPKLNHLAHEQRTRASSVEVRRQRQKRQTHRIMAK